VLRSPSTRRSPRLFPFRLLRSFERLRPPPSSAGTGTRAGSIGAVDFILKNRGERRRARLRTAAAVMSTES